MKNRVGFMSERSGYRGYIASRTVRGEHTPQRLQNLLVRDYAARNGLTYLLSATEYVMPSCYMMLENVLGELPHLQGIIAFSAFMLPAVRERRARVFERVLAASCEIHFALENMRVSSPNDVSRIDDLLAIAGTLPRLPFHGWSRNLATNDPQNYAALRSISDQPAASS